MADQEFEVTAKLQIRTITANDAVDLHTYCFSAKPLEELEKEIKQDVAQARQGKVFRVVAEASGHPIGHIRLERSKLDDAIGEINQLAVSPPFRKFDVADHLVKVIEEVAADNKMQALRIEVPKSETAIIEAYKKWGFGERPVVTLQKEIAGTNKENPDSEAEAPGGNDEKGEQQELL